MADVDQVVAAPAKAAKVKTPKKKTSAKTKKPLNHPKYSEMIKAAVVALKERGGSSRQAVLKYVLANYNVGKEAKTVNNHLKLALKAGVKNGKLKQSKGTGASGSFKLGEDKAEKKPKAKSVSKKPAAKKPKSPKKVKAKKPAGEKKAKPAKKVNKPKAAKSPAKAKAAKPKKAVKSKAGRKKTPKKSKPAPKK